VGVAPQELPTGASLLAAFHRDLLARCAANYTATLAGVDLPAGAVWYERKEDRTSSRRGVRCGVV
jgi:hypothetical protein